MRTISSDQDKILTQSNRSTFVKVEIDRSGAGEWVDMTALEGYNWVKSANIQEEIDQPQATASVVFKRNVYDINLSPLMSLSKINVGGTLVNIHKKIRISSAVMPHGSGTPTTSDWVLMFDGRIDNVNMGGEEISVDCRDLSGDLMDTMIESVIFYGEDNGSAAGTILAETVMGTILTDWSTGFTVYTPSASGWYIKRYGQDLMPVFQALKILADQIGWDLRYKWDNGTSAFRLTFSEPDRISPAVDRTFTASQYWSIDELSISKQDVRNVVRVVYRDRGEVSQFSEASDATSITKYGRRFMQIDMTQSRQLNTSTEAVKMRDGALYDLMEPTATHGVRQPYFWPIQIGDYYTFSANNVHYDTNQSLAVVGFTHSFEDNDASTNIICRGTPASGGRSWLGKEFVAVQREYSATNVALGVSSDGTSVLVNGSYADSTRG